MCDPVSLSAAVGGSIGVNAYAAYEGAKAERQQAYFEAGIADTNAKMADAAAADAIRRGGLEANTARQAGRRLIGQQRTAAAAGGVDVNTGGAAQLQAETEFLTEQDVATIRTNAARAAWGHRVEAGNYRAGAAMQRAVGKSKSPGRAAAMSLLSDATGVAKSMMFAG